MKDIIHTYVVLAYKESKYLEDCVKSVLNQEYKSNVVIATTTDNKYIRNIAKKYKLDVIVGKHSTIGGDFDFARNCSNTVLTTIAHQDDIYDYGYSKTIVDEYNRSNNKNISIIFTDYYEIRNNEKIFKNTNLSIKRVLLVPLRFKCLGKYKFFKRLVIRFGNSICCPAVSYVNSNCDKKIFAPSLKCNVDWDAWEALSRKDSKFIYNRNKLVGHRISDESTTTNLINDSTRTNEDLKIYNKFWPQFISKRINKLYRLSEKSNNLKK